MPPTPSCELSAPGCRCSPPTSRRPSTSSSSTAIYAIMTTRQPAARRTRPRNLEVIAKAQDLDALIRELDAAPRVLALDPGLPGTSRIETLMAAFGIPGGSGRGARVRNRQIGRAHV